MIFTASGRFESAPVVENVEVATAMGGGDGGHSDGDVSSRPDRKRKRHRESLEAGASNIVDGPDLDGKHVVLQS